MNQIVKFISSELTLGLRSQILRNNLPLNECVFPTDNLEGAFHLGLYEQNTLLTIASFFPNNLDGNEGKGYQLRGMATDIHYAGKGNGKQLLTFAIEHLQHINIQYLWCNARTSAVPFYKNMGFEFLTDEFDIAGVGPHYKMIFNFNKI